MIRKWLIQGLMFLLALALVSCNASTGEPAVSATAGEEPTVELTAPPTTTEEPGGEPAATPAVIEGQGVKSAAAWALSEGRWEAYTTEHGLPSDRIHALAVDAQGHLWVGTDRGGGRFDGATWEDIVPLFVNLMDIAFDDQGRAWLADGRGVDVYDGGTLTTYGYEQGLSSVLTEAVLVDGQGRVWVGFATGGSGCSGGEGGGGVDLFEDGQWSWHDTSDLFSSTVLDLAEDGSGNIWAVGENGLARFDGASWEPMRLPGEETTQMITCVAADPAGRVWFGTKRFGLWTWDGQAWSQYTTADGLAGDTVWAVAFDGADRTWVGTSGGLSVLDDGIWTTYTAADGLAYNDVRAFAFAEDGVWIGTWRGLNHLVFDAGSE